MKIGKTEIKMGTLNQLEGPGIDTAKCNLERSQAALKRLLEREVFSETLREVIMGCAQRMATCAVGVVQAQIAEKDFQGMQADMRQLDVMTRLVSASGE